MITSRGFARVSPGPAFQNQILRAPVRCIPRPATSQPRASSTRQFGTILRSHVTPAPCTSTIRLLLGRKFGAAGILPSQSILCSNQRFASTNTTNTSTTSTPVSEFSADNIGYTSVSDGKTIGSDGAFDTIDNVDSVDLTPLENIQEQVGYMAAFGLDFGWGPTALTTWMLEHAHFDFGLPWWGAVIATAVVTKAFLLYPGIIAQESTQRSKELSNDPFFKERMAKFQGFALSGRASSAEIMKLRNQINYMRSEQGIKTSHMLLPFLQIPMAFGMFRLTRAMATLPLPGLDIEKCLWMTDMTVPDPLYLLPCASVALMIYTMRLNGSIDPSQAAMAKLLPWILGPITIVFTIFMPAVTQIYFLTTSVLSYVQVLLFAAEPVRKLCGLPPLTHAPQPGHGGGPSYQAPRALGTTAVEHKLPAKKPTGLRATIRQAKEEMMEKIYQFTGENKATAAKDDVKLDEGTRKVHEARDFEMRRLEHEHRKAGKAAARRRQK